MATRGEFGVAAELVRLEEQFVESCCSLPRERKVDQVAERRTPDQPDRRLEPLGGRPHVALASEFSGALDQRGEADRVDVVGIDRQGVAEPGSDDGIPAHGAPQMAT